MDGIDCPKPGSFYNILQKFEPYLAGLSLIKYLYLHQVLSCLRSGVDFVGSTDRASSQQLQLWFSEHFFAPKLAALFVTPIVSATVEQIWREKMSEKPHSIQLLTRFNFSQSRSRKNNRKAFEGASMEPTRFLSIYN